MGGVGDVLPHILPSHLIAALLHLSKKLNSHQNAAGLQRQRQISDEICAAYGLTVLDPPEKYAQDKKMRPGEYRSAARGESWKLRLINTIDLCMRTARMRLAASDAAHAVDDEVIMEVVGVHIW